MRTLHYDALYGTRVEVNGNEVVVTETSAIAPGGTHTARLDFDEVDRLLAVREHAVNPQHDIAEHFRFVHHYGDRQAFRAAGALIACAAELYEVCHQEGL